MVFILEVNRDHVVLSHLSLYCSCIFSFSFFLVHTHAKHYNFFFFFRDAVLYLMWKSLKKFCIRKCAVRCEQSAILLGKNYHLTGKTFVFLFCRNVTYVCVSCYEPTHFFSKQVRKSSRNTLHVTTGPRVVIL